MSSRLRVELSSVVARTVNVPLVREVRPSADVTVVVPTFERAELLPGLIEALKAQDHGGFEVVIVDDASSDDTATVLDRLVAGDDRFAILHRCANGGPAAARNAAWRSAEARWIAFTDDDCRPAPGWLRALLDGRADAAIVQGRTVPVELSGRRRGWFDRSQDIGSWSGRFQTCNLLVDRHLLEELGGFNERFRLGEDTDFGLRAVRSGTRTAFVPDAVVHHHVFSSGFRGFLQQRKRYSEFVSVVAVNPAARSVLACKFLVRSAHLVVLAVVPVTAVALAVRQPWWSIAPVVGWTALNTVRTRGRPFNVAQRFVYSLLQLLGYAYETGCFIVESLRHRVVVI
jgi:glycosyltransferase involved in cell wall biosynthesis